MWPAIMAVSSYHSATVVYYNLSLTFVIIGDVKYMAHVRLLKIEDESTLVILTLPSFYTMV